MHIQSTQQIQVRFTVTDGDDTFTDALYFSQEELASLTEEQLENMKHARFNNWKATVNAPPAPVVELTPQEKVDQIVLLEAQKVALDTKINELAATLPEGV